MHRDDYMSVSPITYHNWLVSRLRLARTLRSALDYPRVREEAGRAESRMRKELARARAERLESN